MTTLAALASLLISAGVARAQYQPVPNFTGVGAGQQFRQAVNNRFSGAAAIAPAIVTIYYSQLPAEVNGAIYYLRDGVAGVPCTGGGSGAFAIGINGQWSCTAGATAGAGGGAANPLTAALNFNTFKGTNAAADTATGDVLSRNQSTLNSLAAPTASYGMNSQVLTGVGYNQQFQARQGGAAVVSSTSTFTGTQVTSITLTAPASIVNGNALVALVSLNGSFAETITPPAGFNAITSQINNGNGLIQIAYCKIANSESGNYAFSWTGSSYFLGGVIQLSGVASCTPDATSSITSQASGTSITIPGAAATQTSDFVLDWATLDGGNVINALSQGALIFNPNLNSYASSSTSAVGTTAPVIATISVSSGFVGQQIAFPTTSSLTQVPVLQTGVGNVVQDLAGHINGVIDVKAPPYNAACDGITDDSAAIQTALNTGLSVEIPDSNGLWCRTTVPLFHAKPVNSLSNQPNSDLFGRSETNSGIRAYFNGGPVVVEANPLAEVAAVGPITAATHLGGGVALCWDGTGTPCGAATGASPGQYVYDIKDWTDTAAAGGIQATNPLNGLTAGNLTIDAEVFVPTGAAGAYLMDSASGVTGAAGHDLFLSVDGTNHLKAVVNIGGTVTNLSAAGFTFNAWHHAAWVYDNHSGNTCATASCLREYIDGVQVAAADVSGSVVQPTYDTWLLGGDAAHFPDSEASTARWDGMIDYFRVTKRNLYPSGTTFTPPVAKPAVNTSDIVLINGDLPATITGFGSTIAANGIVGADGTAGDSILPGTPCTANKCGAWAYIHAAPLLTGEIGHHKIHDLTIKNGGESIFATNAVGLETYNLNADANHVVFKALNNTYGMNGPDNSVFTTHGEAGLEWAHNTGTVSSKGLQINNGTAGQVGLWDQSGGVFSGLFLNPQLGSSLFDVYFAEDSIFTNFTCISCLVDSENNAPTITTGWFEGGEPTLIGGDWQSLAAGSPPSIELTAGTSLSAFGTHFEGGTATGPIFHFIGTAPTATSPHVRLDNVMLNGAPPYDQAYLISDQPSFVDIAGGNFSLLTGYTGFKNGVDQLTVNSLADPATPTATLVGSTGSTSYGPYYVVCHGVGGSTTKQSVGSNTVTNGPASLSVSNYITIAWTAEAGCASWDVLKGVLTTSIATGLNASLTSFNDTGGSTSAYTAPARNTTGDVSGGLFISSSITFANLPVAVVNGARRYCSNCDPPANPPVACSSSGARTGAMADGVNGSWICAY